MWESTISDYVNEMTTKFITGDRTVETEWDSYLNELKAMQVERIIEIYQQIYDATL